MRTIALAAFALATTAACIRTTPARHPNHQNDEPIAVCLVLPPGLEEQAKKGIDWWHENVVYRCPGDVVIHMGNPEPSNPFACAYYTAHDDGTPDDITLVCPDAFRWTRHEFGHLLGYSDTCTGVMASGYNAPFEGRSLAEGCEANPGSW